VVDLIKFRTCFKYKAEVSGKVRDAVYMREGDVVCLAMQQMKPFQCDIMLLEKKKPIEADHVHEFATKSQLTLRIDDSLTCLTCGLNANMINQANKDVDVETEEFELVENNKTPLLIYSEIGLLD
jgi:hypothetical protein